MREIIACALACAFLSVLSSPAHAGGEYILFHHHHHIYKPLIKPLVSDPVKPGGGGSNWTLCPTPAGWVICAIAVGITIRTYQEIQKGCTRDQENWPARLWMKICDWKEPISVRN